MMLKSDILNHIILGDPQAHTTPWNDVSKTIGKTSLRDVTLKELSDSQNTLDPAIFTRAKYVISANERAIAAEKALENKDSPYFGKLMVETYRSLRNNYEVSCEDVDQLMEAILQYGENQPDSVLGTTLNCTIGCIVIMINKSAVSGFIEHIWTKFKDKTPKFYILRPSYGARVLRTPFI
ncbi:galactokinase-like [Hetaerina americana]|uniref:galactokinase-like n=1 Tax=Hetaerina americana TaxID=62018 RepID=UPI003A7F4E10